MARREQFPQHAACTPAAKPSLVHSRSNVASNRERKLVGAAPLAKAATLVQPPPAHAPHPAPQGRRPPPGPRPPPLSPPPLSLRPARAHFLPRKPDLGRTVPLPPPPLAPPADQRRHLFSGQQRSPIYRHRHR